MARKGKETATAIAPGAMPVSRLRKVYAETVVPKLKDEFKFKSTMQIPKIEKIIVNMGTGTDEKELESAIRDMTLITGQKPVIASARKSVASFKLREGQKVGCHVTLRGERMYHFFDKLCTVALPRIRDFQGLSAKSFDGRGNYTFGLKEQLVFPAARSTTRWPARSSRPCSATSRCRTSSPSSAWTSCRKRTS
jgi:large subunit ribosomal protein L5